MRFSSRVDNYVRYRPGYPREVFAALRDACGLSAPAVIADIGSGTGILAEAFLVDGHEVIGIEPNRDMREAGERLLARYPRFRSIAATAETTTIPSATVDLVIAGQAFHWFNPVGARREWARILKPRGWVALVWNERDLSTPVVSACDVLLRAHAANGGPVNFGNVGDDGVARFFRPSTFEVRTFANRQEFDFEGLKGRLLSTSHAPLPDHPLHDPLLSALRDLFDQHQTDGRVAFEYVTRLYFGRLHAGH